MKTGFCLPKKGEEIETMNEKFLFSHSQQMNETMKRHFISSSVGVVKRKPQPDFCFQLRLSHKNPMINEFRKQLAREMSEKEKPLKVFPRKFSIKHLIPRNLLTNNFAASIKYLWQKEFSSFLYAVVSHCGSM